MTITNFELKSFAQVPEGLLDHIYELITPFLNKSNIIDEQLQALVADLHTDEHFDALKKPSENYGIAMSRMYASSSITNFKNSMHLSNILQLTSHVLEYLVEINQSHPNNIENVLVMNRINDAYPTKENLDELLHTYYGLIKLKDDLKSFLSAYNLPENYIRHQSVLVSFNEPKKALRAGYELSNLLMINNWLHYRNTDYLNKNFKTHDDIEISVKTDLMDFRINPVVFTGNGKELKVFRDENGKVFLEISALASINLNALTDTCSSKRI